MPDFVDLYRRVACLPNIPKSEAPLIVSSILASLEQLQTGTRAAYLVRLARRARHHHIAVADGLEEYSGLSNIVVTDANENAIRDLHHDAYYAVFFIARYALVSVGGYDCSVHADVGAVLTKEVQRLEPSRKSDAGALALTLSQWREERNIADYVMDPNRVNADLQVLRQKGQEILGLLATWGVS